MVIKRIKESISGLFSGSSEDPEYVEIDLGQEMKKNKVIVRPFILRKFEDVAEILNSMREGYTIGLVDIKPIKTKDVIELKRSIAKIKKTVDALEGNIAGFGENMIIITPSFAEIFKAAVKPVEDKKPEFMD